MIAKFPLFSKLSIEHMPMVDTIVSEFEPYSDFNFTSLFCWNMDESTQISDLNGNLVIKFPDYLTGKTTYSVLGKKNLDDTLETMMSRTDELRLIPEVVVNNLKNKERYDITLDSDSHDYIYSLQDHASLTGQKFREKRKKVNRFAVRHEGKFVIREINLRDKKAKTQILQAFDSWAGAKSKTTDEISNERIAVTKLVANASSFDLLVLTIELEGKICGFSIHEPVSEDYAICHFHKTISSYPNIDVFLTSQAAQDLVKRGYKYVNWEQDLGISGLRESKQSYKPIKLLKKYIIRKKY